MSLSRGALKVQQALTAIGVQLAVVELPASTRTSQEAAQAIGCQLEQIAKSIVFRSCSTHRAVLVIASGTNRINEQVVAEQLGEPVCKAEADFVREHTGYVIGGVPPVGLAEPVPIFIDQDLLAYAEIWAAAGTPHAVFRLTPADLLRMTGGRISKVT